ncbi:MAG: tetratricopeptide repeat protein, partial [Rhodothermales bacterium]|nr:tetratricopeptide repeat protein [Rhodothermales bacterium]
ALNSILQTNINTTEQQFLDAVETTGSNSRLNDVNPPTANPSLEFSRHSTPAHNTADILSAQAPTQTLMATGGIPVPQAWATTADTKTQGKPDTGKSNVQETSESALSTQSQVTRPRIEIVNANYSPHSPQAYSSAARKPVLEPVLDMDTDSETESSTAPDQSTLENGKLTEQPELAKELNTTRNVHPESTGDSKPEGMAKKSQSSSQRNSELRSKTAKKAGTTARSPSSANSSKKKNSTFIEVTPRPLTAEQQLLSDFRQAANTYKEGNYPETERMLQDLLTRNNAMHKARLLLARVYSQQNLDSRAELVLYNGLLHFPQHAPYVTLYAQMLAEQGRDNVAIEALQNALPGARDNADFHALLAGLYQRNGNSASASKHYSTALRLEPTRGEWWIGLGISSEQVGDHVNAEGAYSEAMKHPLASEVELFAEQRLQQLAASKSASSIKNDR